MRFSLSLTVTLTRYLARQEREGKKRFPIVLMLEPTHRCNLHCEGCGRVHEYKDVATQEMSSEECIASAEECGAPIVTVTGGEPLLHQEVDKIVAGLLKRGRHVLLCTNGILLRQWLPRLEPRKEFILSLHMDGLAATHDRITGKPGTFERVQEAIVEATRLGFRVCTNTTVYKFTPVTEVQELFKLLKRLGVNGMLLSPAFNFESNGSDVFMTKEEIKEKFARLTPLVRRYPVINTPIFMDFLLGKRDLPCTPWGNPTRNIKGWKSPCYMITERHCATFRELMEQTDWERYEERRDPRCANCMTHCGFEPSVVLTARRKLKDGLRMLSWNLFR